MTNNLDEVDMHIEDEKLYGIVNASINAFCSDKDVPKSVVTGSKSHSDDLEFCDSYLKSLRNLASELSIDYSVLKQLADIESKTGIKPNMLISSRGYYEYTVKDFSIKAKKGPRRNRTFSILAWHRK
ncbi:MAG: hypothetical protein E7L09_05540 [Enterobacteriaceae bacterium]|nr:hypothetical protein [Enterobacteriaceae bacterium]